ncbi:hypothetical protein ABL78_6785 [Leptomonas seymouri]|uniref:DDRGK domain-containing protein 1 n=1 Tax=Leptomonas seymouri TaxID=5684 RepID=A0A0N1I1I6_LEPSE|nr:hypothetical protein ABL78_6785 [Leptomonas seymouri]|eukprot:KPI84160.1 hypothetical protein ABL78_6785 [Leptomonas seymouri]
MSLAHVVAALLLLVIGGSLLFLWLQRRHNSEWKAALGEEKVKKGNRGEQQRRGSPQDLPGNNSDDSLEEFNEDRGVGGGMRRRPQRGAGGRDQNAEQDGGDVDVYDENGVKLTRLQRKKLAKVREREERRQAQEAALESQRQRQDQTTQRDVEAALREEELKAAEDAALRELRAEKVRADNEEYAKWVDHIGVEERGELGDEARERQARVQDFLLERAARVQAHARRSSAASAAAQAQDVNRVNAEAGKNNTEGHVLVLQAAARDLKVSVEELVHTIEQMARDGKVDGVFDDRGKYVFIAPEHFPQLAHFLRVRGRVSVQEFTRECNRIIMQT